MKGCRPLTDGEVASASADLARSGRFAARNRCLLALGVLCGFRVTELASINLGDVVRDGRVSAYLCVRRASMKGKQAGRVVRLNEEAQRAILEQARALRAIGRMTPETPLFLSQSGKRLTRQGAWAILKASFRRCGICGPTGTHSMRKTFAARMLRHFRMERARGLHVDPFSEVFRALGHTDPKATTHYLSFDESAQRRALAGMSMEAA